LITLMQGSETNANGCANAEGITAIAARFASPGIQYAVFDANCGERLFCSGVSDAAVNLDVNAATIFLSASTTKVLTTLLVLQLVERGLLRLDDPLKDYCMESPYPSQVTLRMLLNHSSGIPNPSPMTWVHRLDEPGWSGEGKALDAILARYPHLTFAPGSGFQYSNIGYWLLGRVLERVAGRSYAELVRTRIVARLDLPDHNLSCDPDPNRNLARGHLNRFGFVYPIARLTMPTDIWDKSAGRWARLFPLAMNGPAYGGVFATAQGYLSVLSDLLSEKPRLISAPMHKELFRPQLDSSGNPLGVTLGFRQGESEGRRYFSKPGGGLGFCSNIRIYPNEHKATVFLRNTLAFSEKAIESISTDLDRHLF
jgi:D-alanyl-D-alanine carboxypeptidase